MATLVAPRRPARVAPVVRTLLPEDVPALRLPGSLGTKTLRQAVERHPGRSVWAPETLEYALLAPWRHRPEIANVEELDAVRYTEPLLRAAFERCVAHGDELMLVIELDSYWSPSRFERAGLEMVEEIITYELDNGRRLTPHSESIAQTPVTALDAAAIDHLVDIDHISFPWLWRNNRAEFEIYLRTPGVSVSLLAVEGKTVGYIGSTLFPGWGHLDRIAVIPDAQGHGYGEQALSAAVASMQRQGARRVALSTQHTNYRSQRLYQRFGFERTPELDYRLFGAWRRPDHPAASRSDQHDHAP